MCALKDDVVINGVPHQNSHLNICISEEKLLYLLQCGAISGSCFRCLDLGTKTCVKELILRSSASNMFIGIGQRNQTDA